MGEQKDSAPAWLEQERSKWRRFELVAEDRAEINELKTVLARLKPTRRELAVIVTALRVRPGFSLEDFGT